MLDWLRFIGQFLLESIKSVTTIIPMLWRGLSLITTSFLLAPTFLYTIMALMLAVILVMWLVNIL